MKVIAEPEEMHALADEQRRLGRTVGLAPTMGYFHEGHLSLMRASKKDNDFTIVSLFVNPTQFGENEDLDKYPRNMEHDCSLADEVGVDVIFSPRPEHIYPDGYHTYVRVEEWSDLLCGASRPVHFRGVTTVCCKLFNICVPHRAYFGQKDAQQYLIIKKMVADLNMNLEIVPMPIERGPDGLAMSSRNVYLSEEERKDALRLSRSLFSARDAVARGETDSEKIKQDIREHIAASALARMDYVEAVSTETLKPATTIDQGTLIAIAVFFGCTRLIDNIIIE